MEGLRCWAGALAKPGGWVRRWRRSSWGAGPGGSWEGRLGGSGEVGGCGVRFRSPGRVEGVPLFGVGGFGCCILLEKWGFFFQK